MTTYGKVPKEYPFSKNQTRPLWSITPQHQFCKRLNGSMIWMSYLSRTSSSKRMNKTVVLSQSNLISICDNVSLSLLHRRQWVLSNNVVYANVMTWGKKIIETYQGKISMFKSCAKLWILFLFFILHLLFNLILHLILFGYHELLK